MVNELTIIVIALIPLLVVSALVFYLLTRQRDMERSSVRLDTRLEEQGKRGDALAAQLSGQAHDNEEVVRRLDLDVREQLSHTRQDQQQAAHQLQEALSERFGELREGLERQHTESYRSLQGTLQSSADRVQDQVATALARHADQLGRRMEGLTESTDKRLLEIGGVVDRRLSEGFEKTAATFGEVQKRLALIDEAQKNITELSTSVVSLQEILADRTSRGTFGEVQLQGLIRNVLPERSYRMQHKLSNDKIVDCMLFLPDPSGHVPIDSKFPLENFRRMTNTDLPQSEREAARKTFARDVTAHIDDIAAKYIIPGETADAALMFVPAEAVFAEIHSQHPELVDKAHGARVWTPPRRRPSSARRQGPRGKSLDRFADDSLGGSHHGGGRPQGCSNTRASQYHPGTPRQARRRFSALPGSPRQPSPTYRSSPSRRGTSAHFSQQDYEPFRQDRAPGTRQRRGAGLAARREWGGRARFAGRIGEATGP